MQVLETAPDSRTPPRPTVSVELKREGSISTAMLRGYSIRKAGSSSSSDSAFGGGNSSHPVAPAMAPFEKRQGQVLTMAPGGQPR
jgi:hypothetical protein